MSTRIAQNAFRGFEARTSELKAGLVKVLVSIAKWKQAVGIKSSPVNAMRALVYDVMLAVQEFFTICRPRLIHVWNESSWRLWPC
jgi:hypothetical protein